MARAYHEYRDCTDYSTCRLYESIEIFAAEGTLLASVSQMVRVPFDPHAHFVMVGWTPDSTTLYYYRGWMPDGGGIWLLNGSDLDSINASEGYVTHVVAGPMAFGFSTRWNYLSYAREGDVPGRLTIRSLSDGNERAVEVPLPPNGLAQVGSFHWAPQEDGLVYMARIDPITYDIYYLSLDTMIPAHLVNCTADGDNYCIVRGWADDHTIRIESSRGVASFDVLAGRQLELATLTPEP